MVLQMVWVRLIISRDTSMGVICMCICSILHLVQCLWVNSEMIWCVFITYMWCWCEVFRGGYYYYSVGFGSLHKYQQLCHEVQGRSGKCALFYVQYLMTLVSCFSLYLDQYCDECVQYIARQCWFFYGWEIDVYQCDLLVVMGWVLETLLGNSAT